VTGVGDAGGIGEEQLKTNQFVLQFLQTVHLTILLEFFFSGECSIRVVDHNFAYIQKLPERLNDPILWQVCMSYAYFMIVKLIVVQLLLINVALL